MSSTRNYGVPVFGFRERKSPGVNAKPESISSPTNINGLEFNTALDSVRIVNSWSYVNDNFPRTFRSILFTSPTKRSYAPPIQGASSTINCQLIPLLAVYDKTSGSRRHFCQALSEVDFASLNCEALSQKILVG